jgi:hypothetical protein
VLKRLLVAVSSLVVVVCAASPATAAGQSTGDSVKGSADDCIPFSEPLPGQDPCEKVVALRVDVESGPMGEHPAGTLAWDEFGPTPSSNDHAQAEATCLSVRGRLAIIGFTGSWLPYGAFHPPYPLAIAGLVRVADAGGPNSSLDSYRVAYQDRGPYVPGPGFPPKEPQPSLPGPTSCSTFPGPFPTEPRFPFFWGANFNFTNQTGDIVVTDSQALPKSKDQCKNGGWKAFGVFKNQGDCVSFIASKGKNPPASSP